VGDRRTLSPARKKRIAHHRHWRAPEGMLCLEKGEVCLLATGEPVEFDHTHQLATGGTDDDDNIRPISSDAHKGKTKADSKVRGKIRRLAGKNKPKRKRQWAKRALSNPRWKKKLNGKAVLRG